MKWKDGKRAGFTLLEILIAIFIFAIILSTVYTSYTGTFRIVNETEYQMDIYGMARVALERMIEDLESLYVPPDLRSSEEEAPQVPGYTGGEEGEPALFTGTDNEIEGRSADSIRFTSMAHLTFSGEEQTSQTTLISYTVGQDEQEEEEEEGGLVLYRSEDAAGKMPSDEESDRLLLCDRLESVNFTYHDARGERYDQWDPLTKEPGEDTPRMVGILLEFTNRSDPETPFRFFTNVAFPAIKRNEEDQGSTAP